MANEYVPVFFDWMEVTEELNAQEKGRLIDAIVLYARGGDWQEQIKGNERYLFPAFKRQIDRAREISGKRSDAGALGGKQSQANGNKAKQAEAKSSKPKQTEANRSKTANKEEEEYKEDKENDNNNGVSGAKAPQAPARRFTPPTVDDVRLYCQERGNQVDPQRFVDFYASKGWKVGNQTMKDWQACVRTWEKRDNGAAPSGYSAGYVRPENPKNHYEQRSYTDRELEDAVGMDELLREARENYA